MPNMSPIKTKQSHIDKLERTTTFKEVVCEYTKEEVLQEAERCIQCKHKPCVTGCPIHNDIPGFILALREGRIEDAYNLDSQTSTLPAICGRVCPQEKQCEGACTRGIRGEPVAIGMIERYIADYYLDNLHKPTTAKCTNDKVAIIGSGPAGLTCGYRLAQDGYHVDIYEQEEYLGGLLNRGIPDYRLPNDVVNRQVAYMKEAGVNFITNTSIGQDISLEQLREEYSAVFLGYGVQAPTKLMIDGEELPGVYQAIDFLKEVAKELETNTLRSFIGKNVVVIGGGNVAMDASRTSIRLGAKSVKVVYRRAEEDLPARLEEINDAKEEGVAFDTLQSPYKILADNDNVVGLECVAMELVGKGDDGRNMIAEKADTAHTILAADIIISAIGQTADKTLFDQNKELEITKWNTIIVDEETMKTNLPGVFAGGDIVTGALTVVHAIKHGQIAANSIKEYLNK